MKRSQTASPACKRTFQKGYCFHILFYLQHIKKSTMLSRGWLQTSAESPESETSWKRNAPTDGGEAELKIHLESPSPPPPARQTALFNRSCPGGQRGTTRSSPRHTENRHPFKCWIHPIRGSVVSFNKRGGRCIGAYTSVQMSSGTFHQGKEIVTNVNQAKHQNTVYTTSWRRPLICRRKVKNHFKSHGSAPPSVCKVD